MPDVSVVTPAAVVPADRLTLGATDARGVLSFPSAFIGCAFAACMAEE
jgi:hypothetical protein